MMIHLLLLSCPCLQLGELNGVLALCGITDAQGRSVLMVSYNNDTVSYITRLTSKQARDPPRTHVSTASSEDWRASCFMGGSWYGDCSWNASALTLHPGATSVDKAWLACWLAGVSVCGQP